MSTMRERVEAWAIEADETLTFFDGLDDAILGVATRFTKDGHEPIVLYDYDKCIEILAQHASYLDACDHMEFTFMNAHVGRNTPGFTYSLPETP